MPMIRVSLRICCAPSESASGPSRVRISAFGQHAGADRTGADIEQVTLKERLLFIARVRQDRLRPASGEVSRFVPGVGGDIEQVPSALLCFPTPSKRSIRMPRYADLIPSYSGGAGCFPAARGLSGCGVDRTGRASPAATPARLWAAFAVCVLRPAPPASPPAQTTLRSCRRAGCPSLR